MPLLQINSSKSKLSDSVMEEIHHAGALILAEATGKSISYVMVNLNLGSSLSFANDIESPCAYLEVKNVGTLSEETTHILSSKLTSMIAKTLNTEPNRIYIEFQESSRHLWGWNGKTFA